MIFCEQCGFQVQDSWKHCPKCSHQVFLPVKAEPKKDKAAPQLPDDWDPLFASALVMQDEFIKAGLATVSLSEPDSDWEKQWIDAFKADQYRPVFGETINDEPNEYVIHLAISQTTLEQELGEIDTKVDAVMVRVIDDGWSAEVECTSGDFLAAETLAKEIQAQFGGEVVVVKPSAKKRTSRK